MRSDPGTSSPAAGGASAAPKPSAFSQVSEQVGSAICRGMYPAGTVLTVEALESTTGASRSVVREAARVLASKGLLRARKRVGLEVLSVDEWSLFDPQVIRWRLNSSRRQEQLESLQQLRIAIEPEAARLAAESSSSERAGEIMSAAGRLWAAGVDGEQEQFLRDDANFHRLILTASGNGMFAQLSEVIHEALRERTLHQLDTRPISLSDVQLHVDLASQIQRRRGDDAWTTMREIIRRTHLDSHASDQPSTTA